MCQGFYHFFFSHFLDANGKQLVFAVKKGTDSTALWKGTVRVACVKVLEYNSVKIFCCSKSDQISIKVWQWSRKSQKSPPIPTFVFLVRISY